MFGSITVVTEEYLYKVVDSLKQGNGNNNAKSYTHETYRKK